jgi:hypothetical protein
VGSSMTLPPERSMILAGSTRGLQEQEVRGSR